MLEKNLGQQRPEITLVTPQKEGLQKAQDCEPFDPCSPAEICLPFSVCDPNYFCRPKTEGLCNPTEFLCSPTTPICEPEGIPPIPGPGF